MSDLVLDLKGKEKWIEWSVFVYLNASGEYYALAKVGSTVRITSNQQKDIAARDEGCQLVADMFAELGI